MAISVPPFDAAQVAASALAANQLSHIPFYTRRPSPCNSKPPTAFSSARTSLRHYDDHDDVASTPASHTKGLPFLPLSTQPTTHPSPSPTNTTPPPAIPRVIVQGRSYEGKKFNPLRYTVSSTGFDSRVSFIHIIRTLVDRKSQSCQWLIWVMFSILVFTKHINSTHCTTQQHRTCTSTLHPPLPPLSPSYPSIGQHTIPCHPSTTPIPPHAI